MPPWCGRAAGGVGWVLAPHPGLRPLSRGNAAGMVGAREAPGISLAVPRSSLAPRSCKQPWGMPGPGMSPASRCTQTHHPLGLPLATEKSGPSFSCELSSGQEILLGLSLGDEKLIPDRLSPMKLLKQSRHLWGSFELAEGAAALRHPPAKQGSVSTPL